MEVWKIIFLSKWVICRFHVHLAGCRLNSSTPSNKIYSTSVDEGHSCVFFGLDVSILEKHHVYTNSLGYMEKSIYLYNRLITTDQFLLVSVGWLYIKFPLATKSFFQICFGFLFGAMIILFQSDS